MKIFKLNKNTLVWKEMPQINYNWNLPILVSHKREVIAGNSVYESLPDVIIVCVVNGWDREILFDSIRDIETKVAEEGSQDRYNAIYSAIHNLFKQLRKPKFETIDLFSCNETREITEDNYIEPPPYNFDKYGKAKALFNEGFVLSDEFIEEVANETKEDYEVDLEILKELL